MNEQELPYLVEPMQTRDIPEVMEIERVSFPIPWPARAYQYEIEENSMSTHLVARGVPMESQQGLWGRVRGALHGEQPRGPIVGYGGFWWIIDEAHVSTLAVAPDHRRKGIAELLLLRMIRLALGRGVTVVTLEVRVSNTPAQRLYDKYGFTVQGRRPRYYSDNAEDALIMTTPRMDSESYRRRLAWLEARLLARLGEAVRCERSAPNLSA